MKTIEIKKNKAFVNGRSWGKVWGNKNLFGEFILNILFYINKEGQQYLLIINGIDETQNFKNQVKKEFEDCKNQTMKSNNYHWANIK